MRLTILAILCLNLLHADSLQKVWTTPNSEMIESTEGLVPSERASIDAEAKIPRETLPQEMNLDDIPLAKLYPVEQPVSRESVASNRPVSFSEEGGTESQGRKVEPLKSNAEKIDRLQKMIEQQVAAKEGKHQPLEHALSDSTNIESPTASTNRQASEPSRQMLLSQQHILWGLLAAFISFLAILLMLGSRRGRQQDKEVEFDNPVMEDALAAKNMLEEFMALRGEVHMRFLERKQNILFHEEFTHYQKAKALLELEKRYTRLEYIELPKLFSEELETFTQGQRALTSEPELQEITSRFIQTVMQKRDFTKAQKSEILKNLKNHYRTPHHTWDYDEKVKEEVEASQMDYLLQ